MNQEQFDRRQLRKLLVELALHYHGRAHAEAGHSSCPHTKACLADVAVVMRDLVEAPDQLSDLADMMIWQKMNPEVPKVSV